jgi:membrane-associated phospholipid phosphatase
MAILTKEEKGTKPLGWILCISIVIIFLIPYLVVNHLPIKRSIIPFILDEDRIPFLPWTFIIYTSVFIQEAVIIRQLPRVFLKKSLLVAFSMLAVGLIFFILIPIEYPRALYINSNSFITTLRFIDTPGNCFPSLHVAGAVFFAACYNMLSKSKMSKILMWIWTAAITLSVLTTKQHYLVDVFGGIILAIPFIIWVQKLKIADKTSVHN